MTSLDDDVFGDLLDPANPAVSNNTCAAQPLTLAVGASLSCTFEAFVAGDFGDPSHVDTVAAIVEDDEGNTAGDDDTATVGFIDATPNISVAKTAVPAAVDEPGDTVTFTVVVTNTGVEAVTLSGLADDVFGDLLDPANPAVTANTCGTFPPTIPWVVRTAAASTGSSPVMPAIRTTSTP